MDREEVKGALMVWGVVASAALVGSIVGSWIVAHKLSTPPAVEEPAPVAQAAEPSPMTIPDALVADNANDGTWRYVTAYTSEESQTDGTPCIAADGSNICERWQEGETLCGANWVPFGTLLIIDNQEEPDGEDAIVCKVADRMSSKHPNGVDLYMGYNTEAALEFGRQTLFVKVYEQ